MGLAGIWDEYTDGETILYTYSIITRAADRRMAGYHNRMPVIIRPDNFAAWLSGETSVRTALDLLETGSGEDLNARPVSTHVNNVRNDSPECLEKLTIDD